MKALFLTLALMSTGFTSFAMDNLEGYPTVISQFHASAETLNLEVDELEEFFALQGSEVKVYDGQDVLIAEGTLDAFGEPTTPELAQALKHSSRMMTLGDTHIYRRN